MPLPAICESPESRGTNTTATTERQRVWTVIASSVEDAIAQVEAAYNVTNGTPYRAPDNSIPDAECVRLSIAGDQVTPAPVGGSGMFRVVANFGSRSSSGGVLPLTVGGPARVKILSDFSEEPADVDVTGAPIVNAAGVPLTPTPTYGRVRWAAMLTWRRSYATSAAATAAVSGYSGKLNSDIYLGAAVRCLRCDPIQVTQLSGATEDGQGIYEFRAVMRFREQRTVTSGGSAITVAGWDLLQPNRGLLLKTKTQARNYNGKDNGEWREIRQYKIDLLDNTFRDPSWPEARKWLESPIIDIPQPLSADGTDTVPLAQMTWLVKQMSNAVPFSGLGV